MFCFSDFCVLGDSTDAPSACLNYGFLPIPVRRDRYLGSTRAGNIVQRHRVQKFFAWTLLFLLASSVAVQRRMDGSIAPLLCRPKLYGGWPRRSENVNYCRSSSGYRKNGAVLDLTVVFEWVGNRLLEIWGRFLTWQNFVLLSIDCFSRVWKSDAAQFEDRLISVDILILQSLYMISLFTCISWN